RIAGDGINYVTPSATIGGEVVKARLLQRRIPAAEAVSSVSLAVINQFLSRIVFVLASIPFLAKQILELATAPLAFGVCGFVEIRLILYFLHVPAGWATAVAIEGLSILVDQAFFYVPAKIGTQEGGKYFIFLLLGLNPASGFALGVVRRLREIAWVFVGLLIL